MIPILNLAKQWTENTLITCTLWYIFLLWIREHWLVCRKTKASSFHLSHGSTSRSTAASFMHSIEWRWPSVTKVVQGQPTPSPIFEVYHKQCSGKNESVDSSGCWIRTFRILYLSCIQQHWRSHCFWCAKSEGYVWSWPFVQIFFSCLFCTMSYIIPDSFSLKIFQSGRNVRIMLKISLQKNLQFFLLPSLWRFKKASCSR